MNLKDAITYRKMQGKKPTDPILAFEDPCEINEVILYDKWRFRILKELTREEFMKSLKEHKAYSDCTSGEATIVGSKTDFTDSKTIDEPDKKYKYFYKVEVI